MDPHSVEQDVDKWLSENISVGTVPPPISPPLEGSGEHCRTRIFHEVCQKRRLEPIYTIVACPSGAGKAVIGFTGTLQLGNQQISVDEPLPNKRAVKEALARQGLDVINNVGKAPTSNAGTASSRVKKDVLTVRYRNELALLEKRPSAAVNQLSMLERSAASGVQTAPVSGLWVPSVSNSESVSGSATRDEPGPSLWEPTNAILACPAPIREKSPRPESVQKHDLTSIAGPADTAKNWIGMLQGEIPQLSVCKVLWGLVPSLTSSRADPKTEKVAKLTRGMYPRYTSAAVSHGQFACTVHVPSTPLTPYAVFTETGVNLKTAKVNAARAAFKALEAAMQVTQAGVISAPAEKCPSSSHDAVPDAGAEKQLDRERKRQKLAADHLNNC